LLTGGAFLAFLQSRLVDDKAPASFNDPVPHVLESASSGRAKCRACGKAIPKGDLRLGEALPNPYGEGETHAWFHLLCGACARPEAAQSALAATDLEVPDRAWLESAVQFGIDNPRVTRIARAERASSGRATCRSCRELIEKGTLRIALHMFEEMRMNPVGTIHGRCAPAYFGTTNVMDRIERLTPEMSKSDLAELATLIEEGKALTESTPGLAKTRPSEPPAAPADTGTDEPGR
jgi:hypothetical protein